MKITGTGRLGSVPARPGRVSRGAGSGGFASAISSEPEDAAPVRAHAPMGAVDGILAAQEVPDALKGRSRGLARGYNLLDRLDDIRLGLLMGSIPRAGLLDLRRQLRERRGELRDPRLAAILDEIDLRAAVELAKLDIA